MKKVSLRTLLEGARDVVALAREAYIDAIRNGPEAVDWQVLSDALYEAGEQDDADDIRDPKLRMATLRSVAGIEHGETRFSSMSRRIMTLEEACGRAQRLGLSPTSVALIENAFRIAGAYDENYGTPEGPKFQPGGWAVGTRGRIKEERESIVYEFLEAGYDPDDVPEDIRNVWSQFFED